jgi:dTDP-4-dehydrorhamnose 3,5-epimerase
MLDVVTTEFKDLVILTPKVFHDGRGYFFEAFNEKRFKDRGIRQNFIQDNQSYSEKGTLRGLHFQTGTHAQAKLVRVLQGEILDVVVDLRKNEPTFGKHYSILLSDKNFKQFLVPRGFAHGFVVLSETALVHYKCDNYYAAHAEAGIHFNDPDLKIDWQTPTDKVLLSDKDKKNLSFKEIISNEQYISHWG